MGNESNNFKRLSKTRSDRNLAYTAESNTGDDGLDHPVVPITTHRNHPVHEDRKLIQAVIAGDRSAFQVLVTRAAPFIEIFATDAVWENNSEGYQKAISLLSADRFLRLQQWNGERCPLNRFLDHLFRSALTKVIKERRQVVANDPRLHKAIRQSIDELSDVHYWILCKIVIENVPRKKIFQYADQLPELRLTSPSSIGSTYCRALRRLAKICPKQYTSTVNEFINTRKRSGKLR